MSDAQLGKWERADPPVIRPVQIPGIRAVRYRANDIRSFAVNIAHGRLTTEPDLVEAV